MVAGRAALGLVVRSGLGVNPVVIECESVNALILHKSKMFK